MNELQMKVEKLKEENAFTTDKVFTLTKALFPKEVFKEELLASLNKVRNDFKNGNVISSEEVRKEMMEKIQSYQ
tara:strand:- start:591 stop:812 length:222 start_codon:yes stop_codon:yes gene_type:complete